MQNRQAYPDAPYLLSYSDNNVQSTCVTIGATDWHVDPARIGHVLLEVTVGSVSRNDAMRCGSELKKVPAPSVRADTNVYTHRCGYTLKWVL